MDTQKVGLDDGLKKNEDNEMNVIFASMKAKLRKMTLCKLLSLLVVSMMSISVNGANNLVKNDYSVLKNKGFYERMLEKFCRQYYNELFTDFWGTREYVVGSLTIDYMRIAAQREINVFGMHDFKGRLGYPIYHKKFKANVYESKKTPNEYIITFEKESQNLISGQPYFESRTKTFHYEE